MPCKTGKIMKIKFFRGSRAVMVAAAVVYVAPVVIADDSYLAQSDKALIRWLLRCRRWRIPRSSRRTSTP